MESYETLAATLALTMGASWASGINLYAALAVLGIGGATGSIELPAELAIVENPLVFGAASLMYLVEFFADKIPGVDSAWDAIHTFIRIPAGAMLAAGAVGDVSQEWTVAAGLLGGSISAATHTAKASARLAVNTSPEPFSNSIVSITEDGIVLGGLYLAFAHPWIAIGAIAVFLVLLALILPLLWRFVRAVFGAIARLFGAKPAPVPTAAPAAAPEPTDTSQAEAVDRLGDLERLQQLRDAGTLTDEEFEREKQRLLEG